MRTIKMLCLKGEDMHTDLKQYYAKRANEYDQIYFKHERQDDLKSLSQLLSTLLIGRQLLEIACGTGYWTQFVAPVCNEVLATDYNSEVLQLAQNRLAKQGNVSFQEADAFNLDVRGSFNGGLSAFWWSHVEKEKIPDFLNELHSKLLPGSRVVFADNNYVPGSNTPISRIDEEGNTYQIRPLSNGTTHEILKNFPTEKEFRLLVSPFSNEIHFESFEYFWCGWYDI